MDEKFQLQEALLALAGTADRARSIGLEMSNELFRVQVALGLHEVNSTLNSLRWVVLIMLGVSGLCLVIHAIGKLFRVKLTWAFRLVRLCVGGGLRLLHYIHTYGCICARRGKRCQAHTAL